MFNSIYNFKANLKATFNALGTFYFVLFVAYAQAQVSHNNDIFETYHFNKGISQNPSTSVNLCYSKKISEGKDPALCDGAGSAHTVVSWFSPFQNSTNSSANVLRFNTVFREDVALPNFLELVITDGSNPFVTNSKKFAVIYVDLLDLLNPKFSSFEFNGSHSINSFVGATNQSKISSSLGATPIIKVLKKNIALVEPTVAVPKRQLIVDFTIDVSSLVNFKSSSTGWYGIGFGSKNITVSLKAAKVSQIQYDQSGFVTSTSAITSSSEVLISNNAITEVCYHDCKGRQFTPQELLLGLPKPAQCVPPTPTPTCTSTPTPIKTSTPTSTATSTPTPTVVLPTGTPTMAPVPPPTNTPAVTPTDEPIVPLDKCTEQDVSALVAKLDSRAADIDKIANQASSLVLKRNGTSKNKRYIRKILDRTSALQKSAWTQIWSFPTILRQCGIVNSRSCQDVSVSSIIDSYKDTLIKLRNLARGVTARAKRTTAKDRANQLSNALEETYANALAEASGIPTVTLICLE
jgi:hypothetical protein